MPKTGVDGYHPPIEEYLKTIYELEEEGIPAIRARLAERLGHSPPTITEMVSRLIDNGYLETEGKQLQMTAEGRAQGVRRNRRYERREGIGVGFRWSDYH